MRIGVDCGTFLKHNIEVCIIKKEKLTFIFKFYELTLNSSSNINIQFGSTNWCFIYCKNKFLNIKIDLRAGKMKNFISLSN